MRRVEHEYLEEIGNLKGVGWLRVRGLPTAAASYRIKVSRYEGGKRNGRFVAEGILSATVPTMLEAQGEGHATLVLADGNCVSIAITHVGNFHGVFHVSGSGAAIRASMS